jgi:acetyl esterase/lipase
MFRSWIMAGCCVLLGPATTFSQVPQEDVHVEKDIVFSKDADELKLDMARPKNGDGPFPAVVCIHGGGWVGGDRKQMAATIVTLAGRGYVAVSPDYRLAPRHPFPAAIEDCKLAVRWLRANAAQYKIDPNRIGVVGLSAGAHLACLLAVTNKEDGLEGTGGYADVPSRVQAVVSFFGPTDLTRKVWSEKAQTENLRPLLGGTFEEKAEVYRRASPITYPAKGAPPFLFFHGSADTVVPPDQSRDFCAKLQAAGVSARVVLLENEGHGWRGDKLLDTISQMVAFFDETLKK